MFAEEIRNSSIEELHRVFDNVVRPDLCIKAAQELFESGWELPEDYLKQL